MASLRVLVDSLAVRTDALRWGTNKRVSCKEIRVVIKFERFSLASSDVVCPCKAATELRTLQPPAACLRMGAASPTRMQQIMARDEAEEAWLDSFVTGIGLPRAQPGIRNLGKPISQTPLVFSPAPPILRFHHFRFQFQLQSLLDLILYTGKTPTRAKLCSCCTLSRTRNAAPPADLPQPAAHGQAAVGNHRVGEAWQ